MNKLKLFTYLFATIILVSFTGCDKDDDEDVSPNVSLLTAGKWTGNAVFINGQDVTSDFEEDAEININLYTSTFNRDGSYTDAYSGTTVATGKWLYENNERVIVFDKGTADEYSVVISKLDEDELFYIQSGVEFRFRR